MCFSKTSQIIDVSDGVSNSCAQTQLECNCSTETIIMNYDAVFEHTGRIRTCTGNVRTNFPHFMNSLVVAPPPTKEHIKTPPITPPFPLQRDKLIKLLAPCRIWGRGTPYCDCDGCDRMSKRGLRMRAGWRHDWNSADNEFARVIIPGPFCEPALVTSSPFVFLSTDHRERRRDDCSRYFPAHQRRCAILRSGIPDPWAEYLTLRGVPQVCRRANPEEVHLWRDHLDHVEFLWGRIGLSLAQGIPDPWKNWPKCCSSQKRRPDACQRLKTIIPRTCRNRSNSCDSFLTQREAELQFYHCGDPKDMRAKSDSVLICRPRNKNEWHGPTFNTEEYFKLEEPYTLEYFGGPALPHVVLPFHTRDILSD
uniref:(California timema) hypothetical protein n=1 Tax=Timema californicum TaxID=61474 RepID=A0A7R9J6A3_TIMCA|nr:unnamed protein product [Timema californicum]